MVPRLTLLTASLVVASCLYSSVVAQAYSDETNSLSNARLPRGSNNVHNRDHNIIQDANNNNNNNNHMMESFHRSQRLLSLMEEHPTMTRSEMNEMIGIQMHHQEQIHAALLRLEQEQALQADFILRVQNAMKDPTWNRYSHGDIFTECWGFLFLGGMMLFYIYGTAMAKYRSLSTPHGRRQTWMQLLGVSSFGLFCAFWQDPLA